PPSHRFPYTTLFRSIHAVILRATKTTEIIVRLAAANADGAGNAKEATAERAGRGGDEIVDIFDAVAIHGQFADHADRARRFDQGDRKSTRLNSSHVK